MGTYDFDRFKDNSNTYLCKDTQGRQNLDTAKTELNNAIQQNATELNNAIQQNATDTDRKLKELKESLKDRYVLIGDSYMEGYTPDGNVESFAYKLKRMLHSSDKDFIISYYGGVGFVNTVAGKTYKTLTQEAYNKTTNPETITHVIYAGGYNDNARSSDIIQQAINDCYSKMHELFPNAVMYLANIASTFNHNGILWHLHDNVAPAYSYAGAGNEGNNKICDLGYLGNALHNRGMMASDGMHPGVWGQTVIALSLAYKLRGGEFEPQGAFKDFTARYTASNSSSTVTGKEFYNKDTLSLVVHRIEFNVQPSIANEIMWAVGNINTLSYVRKTYHYMASTLTTGLVAYNAGTAFKSVPMTIGVNEDGMIYVRLHNLKSDGTNYEELGGVKFIAFDDVTLRVPLCYI